MATPNYGPILAASPALANQAGILQLAGALGGTYLSPTVLALTSLGITLPTSAGTAGQVLALNSALTAFVWVTPSGSGGGSTNPRVTTDTYSASLTPSSITTDIYRVTLSGNPTINTPASNASLYDGQKLQIRFIQDGSGSRTVTWGPGYGFSTDTPVPTLSTAAGLLDILAFQYDANKSKWLFQGADRGY